MGIISQLYNKTFNIYRISNAVNDYGEVSTANIVLLQRNVSGRLASGTINEQTRSGALKDNGLGGGYMNKIFFPSGTNIRTGDRIIEAGNTTNRYYADYVNKAPGGLTDHHIEVIVTSSDFMVAS